MNAGDGKKGCSAKSTEHPNMILKTLKQD